MSDADPRRDLLAAFVAAPIPTSDDLDKLADAVAMFAVEADDLRDAFDRASGANDLDAVMGAAVQHLVASDDLTVRASAVVAAMSALREQVRASGTLLRVALAKCLQDSGATYAQSSTHRAFPHPGAVHVETTAELPARFWRDREPAPDKAKIREAIEDGEVVPGACLSRRPPGIRIEVRRR